MTRCYNFCAGPASLPEAVLEIARNDMLDWVGAAPRPPRRIYVVHGEPEASEAFAAAHPAKQPDADG